MCGQKHDPTSLIPSPSLVRLELARSVREARRLRSLLRLALLADEDRRFIRALIPATQGASFGREEAR